MVSFRRQELPDRKPNFFLASADEQRGTRPVSCGQFLDFAGDGHGGSRVRALAGDVAGGLLQWLVDLHSMDHGDEVWKR